VGTSILRLLIGGAALLVAVAPSGRGAIITQWDMNSAINDGNPGSGSLVPSTGVGTAFPVGGATANTYTAGSGADPSSDNSAVVTSSYPAISANNRSAGMEFAVSTLGSSNIVVSFDQSGTSKASRLWTLQYSTDGSSFNNFADYSIAATFANGLNTFRFDLSSVSALNNNPDARFRLVARHDTNGSYSAISGTYATNALALFDEFTVESVQTAPEPGAVALVVVPILSLFLRRRR
jgi:hypothetical protein